MYEGDLMGYFVKAVQELVHKGGGHQHPECICAKILHKMRLVSENEKIVVNHQLIVIVPTVSCTKVLLSESTTNSLQNIKMC